MEEKDLKETIEAMQGLIERRDDAVLLGQLRAVHSADVAALIDRLDEEEREYVFGLLDSQMASDVLPDLDDSTRGGLLEEIDAQKLTDIVDEMESDEAADVVAELSDEVAERVLESVSEEVSQEVKALLQHEEDTAGGLMTLALVAVHQDATIDEAISAIRRAADEVREIEHSHYVYVIDDAGKLVGIVPFARLLIARSDLSLADVMERDVVAVSQGMDQEEVAHLFRKYDLVAAPVVDEEGMLVGRITVDDVVHVMEEEASEDIQKMAGTGDEAIREASVFRIAGIRLPWILTSLFGGLLSGSVIRVFKGTLGQVLSLAIFIPVITAMGGNIGIQSASITVRGLALGQIELFELWKRLFRELRVGVVMGLLCGGGVGIIALLWQGNPALGLVVGVAMLSAITVAATMGALVPVIFKKLNIDPAIAAGPFVTTSNDIIGLLIYFSIATGLLHLLVRG